MVRLLRGRNPVTEDRRASFTDVISIPCGNLHRYVALDDALAAEPGMQSQIGGRLQAVELVVFRFREVLFATLDDDVAGGARVIASAGMLQMHTAVEGNVEQRFRLAVIFVGQLSGFEFHRHVGGEKRYFGHTSSIAGRDLLGMKRRGLIRFVASS